MTLQDVRRVVLSARRQGKRVILGGHSLGASMTVAYASWDFDGRPGYKDLDGLVLIDGGLLGSFSTPDLAATKKAVKALDANGPVRRPPRARPAVGGRRLRRDRRDRRAEGARPRPSIAQAFPLAAGGVQAADPGDQPRPLRLRVRRHDLARGARAHPRRAGHARPRRRLGRRRGHADRARLAQTFGQEPANATEWYFPAKLCIDVDAANALTRNAQTDYLGCARGTAAPSTCRSTRCRPT